MSRWWNWLIFILFFIKNLIHYMLNQTTHKHEDTDKMLMQNTTTLLLPKNNHDSQVHHFNTLLLKTLKIVRWELLEFKLYKNFSFSISYLSLLLKWSRNKCDALYILLQCSHNLSAGTPTLYFLLGIVNGIAIRMPPDLWLLACKAANQKINHTLEKNL